jgi:hypothetical protein
MAENIEQKVVESLQAAGITPTTEFLFTPVTSVVLVLLDGMTEPLLLKRLDRVKGDGGEFVSFYAAKTRFGRTRALNWRTETTFPTFQWQSGERVDVPYGVYAIKAETNRALELFGKNLGSEHERRVNAALRDMLITVEHDAFFGAHDPDGGRFEMDGLDTLIPSSNVVTLDAPALTYDAVVEAARVVRNAGGIPRELYASSIDIENVVRELSRTYGIGPEGQAKWLTGELPIPTPYGNIKPIVHPLFPATGNRKAFVLDPDTPTDDGPSVHLRYLGDEMPIRIDLPGADLTVAQGFLWIVALAVPGRYWQAAISITPPAGE